MLTYLFVIDKGSFLSVYFASPRRNGAMVFTVSGFEYFKHENQLVVGTLETGRLVLTPYAARKHEVSNFAKHP